jgi:hypothetical protein
MLLQLPLPPPPPAYSKSKNKLWIAIGIVGFIIFLIVAGAVGSLLTTQQNNDANPSVTATPQPTATPTPKPLSEYLPKRQDISTEWVKGGTQDETLSATGFVEGIGQSFSKSGLEQETVTIEIYRFNSSNNALNYYNTIVTPIIDTGGYTQVSTASLGIKSYGTDTSSAYGFNEVTTIYGTKLNIYFTVKISSPLSYTQTDAIQFAEVVANNL